MNKKDLIKLLPNIGKHFLRELKNRKLYLRFRELPNEFNQVLTHAIESSQTSYKEHEYRGNDEFALITCVINTLLHHYLEGKFRMNPTEIGMIGASIFNNFCTEIFGEEATQAELKNSNPHGADINHLHSLLERYKELQRANPSDTNLRRINQKIESDIETIISQNDEMNDLSDDSEWIVNQDDKSNIFYRGLSNIDDDLF